MENGKFDKIFPLRPFWPRAAVATVAVAMASVSAATPQGAEPQEVQVSPVALPPLAPLEWRLPGKYATLDGDRLIIDIPSDAYPADAVAVADLPADLFEGAEGFSMSISAKGKALARPTKSYLGLKFQMHGREEKSGRDIWPNCANRIGDFTDPELRNDASFFGVHPDTITLMLGLQGTSGRVEFDLSTLCGARSPGLFRRINRDFVVRYPDDPVPVDAVTSDELRVTSDINTESPLVTRHSSPVTNPPPLVTRHSSPVTGESPLVTRHPSLARSGSRRFAAACFRLARRPRTTSKPSTNGGRRWRAARSSATGMETTTTRTSPNTRPGSIRGSTTSRTSSAGRAPAA